MMHHIFAPLPLKEGLKLLFIQTKSEKRKTATRESGSHARSVGGMTHRRRELLPDYGTQSGQPDAQRGKSMCGHGCRPQ